MPIYQYAPNTDQSCDLCRTGFELLERLNDQPLAVCPACKAPIRRVIAAINLSANNANLNSDNLDKKGFTQYRRIGKGQYEKTAGKGPQYLGGSSETSDH